MRIEYLNRSAIDDKRWNICIDRAVNGIVYAYTWYLDIVSPNWGALVGDDYDYIFPLPVLRRFGVNVLQQPLFTQQLGLFSRKHITPEVLDAFLLNIPKHYRYVNIHLNTLNKCESSLSCKERVTYQLELVSTFNKIQSKYSQNTRRNNLKAIALGVSVVPGVDVESFLDLFIANNPVKFSGKKYFQIRQIVEIVIQKGLGEIVGAYIGGTLCASAFIVKSNGKLIYLFACSSPVGLKNRAMFAIVDQLIRWNAESHRVLDFEGSMIPSVARFYAGFGAEPCNYWNVVIDRLPFYVRILFRVKELIR
ncbi:MAG: hypothetical protein AB7S48_13835 [Bacteroidales bacterium]